MFCTLGVTRTPTTLLGSSAVGAGMAEGCDGGSVKGFAGEVVDFVMTELVAVEDGGMLVTSSPLLLLVGPARDDTKEILLF